MVSFDDFEREIICIHKNDRYSVRDNGAVFRFPRDSKKPRPSDNKWTFGKLNYKTGYLGAVIRKNALSNELKILRFTKYTYFK
jgi:hypothetical protein